MFLPIFKLNEVVSQNSSGHWFPRTRARRSS